jgi:hypothetical protein
VQNAKLDIAIVYAEKALFAYDNAGATTALEKAIGLPRRARISG